jgi:Flp pilus assembly protein CpaB
VIDRRISIGLAIAASALAAILYYAGAQRSSVVVAARDVDAIRPLDEDDLALIALPRDAIAAGAIDDIASAVGRVPRAPLWKGQLVLRDALGGEPATFHTGLGLPAGMRAVALPVAAAQAIGGAIVPGAQVDVIAVPIGGRAPAGRTTELLAEAALVLDVRTDNGAPYGSLAGGASAVVERIGSVVVAIPRLDEIRFADRIATSTFVLVLAATRE